MDMYLEQKILERYAGGASKPEITSFAQLIGSDMTAGGKSTYFEETIQITKPNSDWLISSSVPGGTNNYAGVYIDFKGLGTAYNTSDLIGLGFNTTCQTCSNHYSLEFTSAATSGIAPADWQTKTINGVDYKYAKKGTSNNTTLYVDVDNMKGNINNGNDLSNMLVEIMS